ncbi:hypothetical protein F4778DRAFT_800989 [Xylariomycetidae sp. FL2044]|nr:hypothetical protein F4778DRAFT_800989 [Xylariomycetidae sp. FL2044]
MTERDDSDSSQPRKRIAVACGRCRKRKIRCSGDPGNGGQCSNCKNAGYEPCLFLRVGVVPTPRLSIPSLDFLTFPSSSQVQSQEAPIRSDNSRDYGYSLDAARGFSSNHRGSSVTPMNHVSSYATEMPAGDVLAASYRSNNPYSYSHSSSSKSYYPAVSGWTGTYPDDGSADYGMNYPGYPIMNQDPSSHLVQGYGRYGSGKSAVYVDAAEASSYSYGNLVHRPAAVSGDSQGFAMSGMAASLPPSSERMVSSDRLLPHVNRTLTGSSSAYRTDGLASYAGSKTSPSSAISEVGYGSMHSGFEASYPAPASTLPSSISHRSASHGDSSSSSGGGGAYHVRASHGGTEGLYGSGDQSLPAAEDSTAGMSYIYGDSKLDGSSSSSSRRDAHSGSGASASVLSNGHVYVPESHHGGGHHHHHHHHHHGSSSHGYVIQAASASQTGGVVDGGVAAAAATTSASVGSSGSSHVHPESHRRAAGSLRGG